MNIKAIEILIKFQRKDLERYVYSKVKYTFPVLFLTASRVI